MSASTKKKLIIGFFLLDIIIVAAVVFLAMNKIAPISWNIWGEINNTDNIAIDGYDPVAYFDHGPAKGEVQYSYKWKDVEWHFSSAENLQKFEQNPEKYAPKYGGYCAFAISKGVTAAVESDYYLVRDGQLFLFAAKSPRDDFIIEIQNNGIEIADKNWAER